MSTILPILVFIVIIGVVIWAAKTNAAHRRQIAEQLDLEIVRKGPTESGEDFAFGRFRQKPILSGQMHGFPVFLMNRSVTSPLGGGGRRSFYTVLALQLPSPGTLQLRIDPRRIGKIQSLFGGNRSTVSTGDEKFDQLYQIIAVNQEDALAFLTPEVRGYFTLFRSHATPAMPDSAVGRFSGDLLTGSVGVEKDRLLYIFSGPPSVDMIPRLKMAAGLLAKLASHIR